MLKSKYQAKDDWNPKPNKEVREKRQTKNLSTMVAYKEDELADDLMSWLD